MTFPAALVKAPFAHRGFHDLNAGRPENSPAAFSAAVERGYAIELDVQLSSDGQAMVFHDYALDRLTAESGPIQQRTAEALAQIKLKGSGRRNGRCHRPAGSRNSPRAARLCR
jgi:glycerophosphoryl diester phosphodiesterase